MKNRIHKKTICLAAAALVLVASLTVGKALAYFTTYTQAQGGVVLDLGFTETTPVEKVVDGAKQLVIKNTGDFDCYVRIKALVGADYTVTYEEPAKVPGEDGKWTPGADGYYYYSDIVPARTGETTQINVNITFPIPVDGEAPDFNVIIIQECTPVLYDENGNPSYNWTQLADVSRTVVQGEGLKNDKKEI